MHEPEMTDAVLKERLPKDVHPNCVFLLYSVEFFVVVTFFDWEHVT